MSIYKALTAFAISELYVGPGLLQKHAKELEKHGVEDHEGPRRGKNNRRRVRVVDRAPGAAERCHLYVT